MASPYRTAHRWLTLYRKSGLAALARKPRKDQGQSRKLSDPLRELIEGLALQTPPLPASVIHRKVCEVARSREEPEPSYIVVYRLISQVPDDLKTLAQEGSKAYGDAYELVHRREADKPNAVWQADHCVLDVLIKGADGTEAKPWLTVILDDTSRAMAGYFIALEDPCAIRTALTLRQAIWRKEDSNWHVCGIPDAFYTDNGSDFASKHMEQVSADFEDEARLLPSRSTARKGAH